MTRAMKLTWVAAVAVVGAACGDGPEFPTVRDVRPTVVEMGDVMVVELDRTAPALDAERPVKVWIEGELEVLDGEGEEPAAATIVLPARVGGPRRVLVPVDDYVEETVGGKAVIDGVVTVRQLPPGADDTDEAYQVVATSGEAGYHLRLFPGSPRKLAHELVGKRTEDQFVAWLGVDAEHVEGGNGLQLTQVLPGFPGLPFLYDYDCGRWSETENKCKGGPDFAVHRAEAASRGYPVDDGTFDRADHDGNDVIDRHEAEHAGRDPSPAWKAGLRPGDVIVEADGRAVSSVGSLLDAWELGEGATVAVTAQRGDATMSFRVARYGQPESLPSGFLLAGILVGVGLLVVLPIPVLGGLIVVWERKISGRMQSRPGPNRVGPGGWLQWLADGVKLIVKEDLTPSEADPILFKLSPFLVFAGVFLTFVALPFSPYLNVADLNVGILYILSVTSVVVVGVIMGGWASNSKWSLLGGMRSAAQIISYELPASISVLTVVVMVGSLSTQDIVRNQGGMPWEWHMFDNPFAFVCFFVFFISALAEGNRTPFDLPEAESELVAGYNTEYSGFRFSIFALAEWVNLIVLGAVVTTVFLGGWNIPLVSAEAIEAGGISGPLHLVAFLVFALKVTALIFVCIWIRWTLPRFRIDHMMNMCWKYFMPATLVSLIGAAVWVWVLPEPARLGARLLIFAVGGVLVAIHFIRRVMYARRTTEVWDLKGA